MRCGLAVLLLVWPALAVAEPRPGEERPPDAAEPETEAEAEAEAEGEVITVSGSVTPGSEHTVTHKQLERYERDDVHQILTGIPGVYVREEDGYGLRPNIGMRGAASDRSAKIALLEDGVLIAPAPYAAPAAYYTPLMTRLERIDVLKGPASIQYGPNTVGGSVNFVSRPMPEERETELDLALGERLYGKLHATHAEATENFGAMIELIKLRTDGFKELDGGGETGFDKNEIGLTLRANTDRDRGHYHRVELKLGYGTELSHETYTGLSLNDFDANPYRRYAATARDRMKWNHERVLLTHRFEFGEATSLTTQLYHNRFARVWRKLNGFDNPTPLHDILIAPEAGNNAVFHAILTGEADSTSREEMLLIGTNDRHFYAQGIQSNLAREQRILGLDHSISAGLRLHRDAADRLHTEEPYRMVRGALVADAAELRVTRDAVGSALAFAAFARDEVALGDLRLSAGLRTEVIATDWDDAQAPHRRNHHLDTVLIPGGGLFYQPLPWLGLLAGVHKGFVPGAPSPTGTASAEESENYEAGFRLGIAGARAEAIGFFNDYSNLKGSCTFSAGCMEDRIDEEFAAGRVYIYGLEAAAEGALFEGRAVSVPLRMTYTFTHSEFQDSFRSDNPQWGAVEKGFELPYLPRHQGSAEVGARAEHWEIGVTGRYLGSMRDVAGDGALMPGNHVPTHLLLDAAAHGRFDPWGELYLTVSNLLDDDHIVSLRPFGARPGAPRLFIVGYKNRF